MALEIVVNQLKLENAILMLSSLKYGTGLLGQEDPAPRCVGEYADALNDAYHQLCMAEVLVLNQLDALEHTLKSAGIRFKEMDEREAAIYQSIIGLMKGYGV